MSPGGSSEMALAIGVGDASDAIPAKLRERDEKPRSRRPLGDFVFGSSWGDPAPLVG